MDIHIPRRRGKSKRTHERLLEDISRSSNRININNQSASSEKSIASPSITSSKKQKIEILNVQILSPPFKETQIFKNPDECNIWPNYSDSVLCSNVNDETLDTHKDLDDNTRPQQQNHRLQQNILEETFLDDSTLSEEPTGFISSSQRLIENLRRWSLNFNISANSLTALLLILIEFGLTFLPRDSRTLKSTPRSIQTREVDPGSYWHFGIKRYLEILKKFRIKCSTTLTLNTSIDGLPICKSSKGSFWPILGKFKEIPIMQPFVIGLYFHHSCKPSNCKDYLKDFIGELNELESNAFLGITVKPGIFIFDAVASAFIRGVVPHNAYRACQKCVTKGKYRGRMCYPSIRCPLRNNRDFRSRKDVRHHNKKFKTPNSSPLEAIRNFDVVKQCPTDYMHLILLGVIKKFLKIILKKVSIPTNALLRLKLKKTDWSCITKATALAKLYQPSDFSRRIRLLENINFFKATELRTFLCYHGIVVLKGNVHSDFYECFKLLHCAVIICLSKRHENLLPVARELFKAFSTLH